MFCIHSEKMYHHALFATFVFAFFINALLCFNKDGRNCGDLFLTVNAVDNRLQFNWDFGKNCTLIPDTLVLYYKFSETFELDLDKIFVGSQPIGHHLSHVEFGDPIFPGNWNQNDTKPINGSHCYPFWLKSLHNGKIVDAVCIKIEPTWMKNFGKLKLGQMMIPGTHDSGAWTGRHIGIVQRYAFTQEMNLWGQLVSGIRYFDLRVGLYKARNPRLWINHGQVSCSKMKEELMHVANFVKKAPEELIILHFHSFEVPSHFQEKDHLEVLALLQEVLGEFILPQDAFRHLNSSVLEDIWALNKSVIISYNNINQVSKYNWLWYPIPHKWGNKQTATDLYYYLEDVKSNHVHPSTPFCVLIAALTANIKYILNNLDKSLGYMADEVNPPLNYWLRNYSWVDDINIIATDFFIGNDVIDISIETNFKRLNYL